MFSRIAALLRPLSPDRDVDVILEKAAEEARFGQRYTGAKPFLLGSVPNKISHHAPRSVLIVRTT